MYISRIFLRNFRNFETFDTSFQKGCNLIIAPNGSGKTNLLESIQILSHGRSLRAVSQIDLIDYNKSSTLIKAKLENNTLEYQIKKLGIGQRTSKLLKRNDKNVKLELFTGLFNSLWFSAETMNVINASSSIKRDFIDNFIGSINHRYFSILKLYKDALHQKNLLLTKNDIIDQKKYDYFNELLIKYGSQIIELRDRYLSRVKKLILKDTISRYFYEFEYVPSIELSEIFEEDIQKKFHQKINEYRHRELVSRRCLVGPHKDTWKLYFSTEKDLPKYDLGTFGSRGQKRIGILSILVTLMTIAEEDTGRKPVLLLDDITSELDEENICIVENIISSDKFQTFITATNNTTFSKEFLEKVNILKLRS